MRTSENLPSETVWEIAEGCSTVLLCCQEAAIESPSTPLGRFRSADSGPIPTFQTVTPGNPANRGKGGLE
jgi:hypothetical protein